MGKLKAIWLGILDSLWFVPALLTLTGAALATLLVRLESNIRRDAGDLVDSWLFAGTAEGAQGVLSAIAGGIITVTGVVFSVTIVALQLASSQFTPRVLRQFTADRANQVVLGVFIGTFTYALLVQRTIRSETDALDRFVPNVAVTGAVILALLCIGFLIFFINHAARSIQAAVIIESVTRDTLHVIRAMYPEPLTDDDRSARERDVPDEQPEGSGEPHAILAVKSGYVQAIDTDALVELAHRHDLLIRVEVEPGTHVLPGQAVLVLWGESEPDDRLTKRLLSAVVQGFERTPHQDVRFGVVELMDIAVKAMSPSVNDPTTALNAIDRLAELLVELGGRADRHRILKDDDGAERVLMRRPLFADVVDLAFNQTRYYSASNPSVAIRMMQVLARCAELSPPARRPPLIEHIHAVRATAAQLIEQPQDMTRVDNEYRAALRQAMA